MKQTGEKRFSRLPVPHHLSCVGEKFFSLPVPHYLSCVEDSLHENLIHMRWWI